MPRAPVLLSSLMLCLSMQAVAPQVTAQSATDTALAADTPHDSHAEAPARELDRIRVFGSTHARSRWPGSVDTLDGAVLRDGQRRVQLSEALQRVPGFSGFDRSNFAQDLQLQSRGFGARSTFGIRGLRLVVDGIPASAADGQGQAAGFPLDTLDRIDVLRAPLSLQYGNASGGAVIGESVLDGQAAHALDAWTGSEGSRRLSLRTDGGAGDWRWRGLAAAFETDGFRPHSAARRRQVAGVLEWAPTEAGRLRLVLNGLRQPQAQDPLGLDRAAYDANPDATTAAALAFDTRKDTAEDQLGLDWRHDGTGTVWWAGLWRTRREVEQFLAVPVAAQRMPTSAGGVIDLGRDSTGLNLGLRREWSRGGLNLGVDAVRLNERRRGFENFTGDPPAPRLGVRGTLRRDERNRMDTHDIHALGDIRLRDGWSGLVGVRRSWQRLRSGDRYLAPGNGDDSGGVNRTETAASAGLVRAWSQGEVFVAWGRGFETPTLNETAYRPDGASGFNADLRSARTRSAEFGLRWRVAEGRGDGEADARLDAGASSGMGTHHAALTVYRIDGRDEIVPAVSSGGRSSFVNAGRTRREGVELGLSGPLGRHWRYALAASWIDARFRSRYTFVAGGRAREVDAGNRMPGIPRSDAFAELAWAPPDTRWRAALEARAVGTVTVDDANTDAAAGHVRLALRGEWRGAAGGDGRVRLSAFVRVDNLLDRRHVGSVIVNEGNGRYFEPAAGRGWTFGMRAAW